MSEVIENVLELLPKDIQKFIFTFVYPKSNTAHIIKRVIDTYAEDHCWYLTKQCRKYYIKNILSFRLYYFASKWEPYEYELGPQHYEDWEDESGYYN